MKLKILAVKDRALDTFLQPMFTPAAGAGIRAFMDEVNNPESPMHKHPEDYDLFELGEFDNATGTFETFHPQQLATAKQMKRD